MLSLLIKYGGELSNTGLPPFYDMPHIQNLTLNTYVSRALLSIRFYGCFLRDCAY